MVTDKERRQFLIEDRRAAFDSARDLLKWTIAALVTINSGAALVTFSNTEMEAVLRTSLASIFAMGAVSAILAAGFATIAAIAHVTLTEVRLGMKLPRSRHSVPVPVCGSTSLYSMFQGFAFHRQIADLNALEAKTEKELGPARATSPGNVALPPDKR